MWYISKYGKSTERIFFFPKFCVSQRLTTFNYRVLKISIIIFRAIAGIGGGGIISLVMIIISDIVSLQDRGKYQSLIGCVFGIASVVGPLLGGTFIGK